MTSQILWQIAGESATRLQVDNICTLDETFLQAPTGPSASCARCARKSIRQVQNCLQRRVVTGKPAHGPHTLGSLGSRAMAASASATALPYSSSRRCAKERFDRTVGLSGSSSRALWPEGKRNQGTYTLCTPCLLIVQTWYLLLREHRHGMQSQTPPVNHNT